MSVRRPSSLFVSLKCGRKPCASSCVPLTATSAPTSVAFQLGKYEAAISKRQQEEKRSSTRKARKEGRMEPHQPEMVDAETDGERVWRPHGGRMMRLGVGVLD
ncbi:hypothetical protein CVT26_010951 [Gymnopilus dilepis]|uniref:Uncharacterized protein n=1 Tax=Gymnopilus dilepis TaxID=231916 RepID=A0A409VJ26_9AGAR|nr:hypothetical protein CVT26_010951 [Gymnopilus dilepis]